jgi:hypothetical protein
MWRAINAILTKTGHFARNKKAEMEEKIADKWIKGYRQ